MTTTPLDTTPSAPGWLDRFNAWALHLPPRIARRIAAWSVDGFWWVIDAVRAWPRAGLVAYWVVWAFAPIPRFEPSWGWWNLALALTWPLFWEIVWEIQERRRWVDDDPGQVSDPQAVWGHMARTRTGAGT